MTMEKGECKYSWYVSEKNSNGMAGWLSKADKIYSSIWNQYFNVYIL